MSKIMDKLNTAFDKQPHIRIKLFDGKFVDYEFVSFGTSDFPGVETIEDGSEFQMKQLLTKHFPDWQQVQWYFDFAEEGDANLWAKICFLIVDGIGYPVGDPEDDPHPIFKELDKLVDQTYLATEGITTLRREDD